MAKTRSNRQWKRSPASPREVSSSRALPVLLWVGFILSFLVASSNKDSLALLTRLNNNSMSLSVARSSSTTNNHRRILFIDEDQVLNIDLDAENVRRGQLRAGNKGRERRGDAWSRMLSSIEEADNKDTEDGDAGWLAGSPTRRMSIPRYIDKHHFDDCVGKTIDECQVLVDAFVQSHPEQFNNQTSLMMDVRKIRELVDESYYKVVLRTNLNGDRIDGIFDDGVVHYPWPWRMKGNDVTVGPWDCQNGFESMSPRDCCDMIQKDVASADDNGNHMACFVEEPVGGLNNPERDDRAIVVVDANFKVVRAPVAH